MAEYITRNNAISAACFGCNQEFSDEPCEPDTCAIRQAIMALPTADVVEVVRCKDCVYRMELHPMYAYEGRPCKVCFIRNKPVSDNEYCSDAIRREDE